MSALDTHIQTVISFYSSTIFERVGYTPTEALYASLGYGAIQVVATIPTLFLIDTKGRRTLTLTVSMLRTLRVGVLECLRRADLPPYVHFPLSCRSVSSRRKGHSRRDLTVWKPSRQDRAGCPVSSPMIVTVLKSTDLVRPKLRLPLHHRLLSRRRTRRLPILCRGVPNHPARAGYGMGRLHQQYFR